MHRTHHGTRSHLFLSLLLIAVLAGCAGQKPLDPFTGDTGGPLSENERATDVAAYELTLEVFPEKRSLEGTGTMVVRARETISQVEVQLDPRYTVPRVRVGGAEASFDRDGGIITVQLPAPLAAGDEARVSVDYSGKPWVAVLAPWEGGFVWSQTPDGKPWIATAVQGEGCDMWWPCKDHFADKPLRMEMHVTVPEGLSVALNGALQSVEELPDGRRTFHWKVTNPISDYNVSLNIGPFEPVRTTFESVNGTTVPIEFWALPASVEKAAALIEDDLRHQIEWYERTVGPYPWGDEKLGLVETPHLGMEHQTLNAYGARFERDSEGFDGLLQHELAHEWFGNLMTHERLNDAWLHEGFGAYMQPAYALDRYGEAFYRHSMYDSYLGLLNCEPVVPEGDPTSDEAFNPDIYGKGAWTLHTLRHLIGDEAFWRATRRLLYDTAEPWDLQYPIAPRYRSTEEFVEIVNEEAGRDLNWLFDVYLREAELPMLEVERTESSLELSWKAPRDLSFPMPVPVRIDGEDHTVAMESGKGSLAVAPETHVVVDSDMVVLRRLPIIGSCEDGRAKREARRRARLRAQAEN